LTENTDAVDGHAADGHAVDVLVADNVEGPDQGNGAENVAESAVAIVAGDPNEVRVIGPDEAPTDTAEIDEIELKKNT